MLCHPLRCSLPQNNTGHKKRQSRLWARHRQRASQGKCQNNVHSSYYQPHVYVGSLPVCMLTAEIFLFFPFFFRCARSFAFPIVLGARGPHQVPTRRNVEISHQGLEEGISLASQGPSKQANTQTEGKTAIGFPFPIKQAFRVCSRCPALVDSTSTYHPVQYVSITVDARTEEKQLRFPRIGGEKRSENSKQSGLK